MLNAGISTSNPLANTTVAIIFLGVITIITLVSLLAYLIVKIIKKSSKDSILYKAMKFLRGKIFWNLFLRYSLEVYLELIIAFTLKLYALSFINLKQGASSILAILVFCSMLLYIMLVWRFLFNKFKTPYVMTLTVSMTNLTVNQVASPDFQ